MQWYQLEGNVYLERIGTFLLSKYILRKESVVIMKKFDFDILTYLYVLRSPEYIYAFLQWRIYMCVYVIEQESV